jgi:molybdenum cofactor guanylyltransferase
VTVTVAGAVLTGGSSTRMGTDKASFPIDGIPMAKRVATAMRSVGCSPIVFVGGDPLSLGPLRERLVPDIAPGAGPAGGVVSAVTAVEATDPAIELVVIASCDLPFLSAAQLRPLVAAMELAGDTADVAVARNDAVQPLCAVWRSSTLPVITLAFESGVRSVFGLLDLLSVLEVPVEPTGLRNVNTLADLDTPPPRH